MTTPSNARKRTRETPQARREQILNEAIRIVGELGYHGFTIQELAQRCGVSNAGLLYHFPSKDQLFLAMLEGYEQRESAALAPVVAATLDRLARNDAPADAVLDLLATMIARSATQPHIGRLYMMLQSETLDVGHPAHASFQAREAAVLKLFATVITPFTEDPEDAARQLLALMDGLSLQWLRGGQSFDIATAWRRAVAVVLPRLTPSPR